jgi:hypothetical protein
METSPRFGRFVFMMTENPDPRPAVPGSNPDPASSHHAPIKSANDARSGVMFGTMRWVLTISMVAVVVVFGVLWLSTQH